MRLRPCIDIHNGKVKQIVGGTLRDEGDTARENFVAEQDARQFAAFYEEQGLSGGHIILLNAASSPWYEATRAQALAALKAFPGRWQAGGGIRPENAAAFLDAGASHVIVTSYLFQGGEIRWDHLDQLVKEVGRDRLVLDLSCRRGEDGAYYIVTDRWQTFTKVRLEMETLDRLAASCAEFLIHAADVEGKCRGVEEKVVSLLGEWDGLPVTYAGGVGTLDDLKTLRTLGRGKVDVTVGSALKLFGGPLTLTDVLAAISL